MPRRLEGRNEWLLNWYFRRVRWKNSKDSRGNAYALKATLKEAIFGRGFKTRRTVLVE